MSAIFGLIHLDTRPVEAAHLERMGTALMPFGPDGGGIWIDSNIGLGQRLMRFTPEDDWENQPAFSHDLRHVLVSDGRIDNRRELIEELGIAFAEAQGLPDSAFILRAYEKWGNDCAAHLVGPFAFALFDAGTHQTLIVRSPMGERSLFYYQDARLFAFSSTPGGLFALPPVPRNVDRQTVADFLVYARKNASSSFFEGINRLEPGQLIVVERRRVGINKYARLEQAREIRFPRDVEYVEAFNALFARVVADQLRSATNVGLLMSGGLDSTAIAAVAAEELATRKQRLYTFTDVPDTELTEPVVNGRYADETPYVLAMGKRYANLDMHFVHSDGSLYLEGLDRYFAAADAPLRNASNWPWVETILQKAGQMRVAVLMTGVPGNLTATWSGDGLLSGLLAKGRWIRAWREARAGSGYGAGGLGATLRILLSQGVTPSMPDWIWQSIQRTRRGLSPFTSRPPWHEYSPIRPEFAVAQRVRERARHKGEDFRFRTSRGDRIRFLLQQADPRSDARRAREAIFRTQTLDPMADARLVEFCLGIPEGQFRRDGDARWLIRRAMADKVPAEILDNRRRGQQGANWRVTMTRSTSRIEQVLARLERSSLASEALDLPRMRNALGRIRHVRSDDPRAFDEYHSVLDPGLTIGSFLAWVEGGS